MGQSIDFCSGTERGTDLEALQKANEQLEKDLIERSNTIEQSKKENEKLRKERRTNAAKMYELHLEKKKNLGQQQEYQRALEEKRLLKQNLNEVTSKYGKLQTQHGKLQSQHGQLKNKMNSYSASSSNNKGQLSPLPPPSPIGPRGRSNSIEHVHMKSTTKDTHLQPKQKDNKAIRATISMTDDFKLDLSGLESNTKRYDPQGDASKLRNMLVYKEFSEKDLKVKLADILTARSASHRHQICSHYESRYKTPLIDNVGTKIKRGHVFALIEGLLQNRARFDAIRLHYLIEGNEVDDIADIVCCRYKGELQLITHEYKKLYQSNLKDDIGALRQSKKTFNGIVSYLFSQKRHDPQNVNIRDQKTRQKLQRDVAFLTDSSTKFKDFKEKTKIATIIIGNHLKYVRELNNMYCSATRSSSNLMQFLETKLGKGSTAGHYLQIRVELALDGADFYAVRIKFAGDKWNKERNSEIISNIFISQFEVNLHQIRKAFNKNKYYGHHRGMRNWIAHKCPGHKYGQFLIKMLENCNKLN